MIYQDIIPIIERNYKAEIDAMPEPNEKQVQYVKDLWEIDLSNKEINTEFKLTTARIYGKLYIKCRESNPELFI